MPRHQFGNVMSETKNERAVRAGIKHLTGHPTDYTDEEREFMMAMDAWKHEHNKPHPDCRDVLAVLLSLGYRKVKEG